MATESDLIVMLNKLLDAHMGDVSKRLGALEAESNARWAIVAEFRQLQADFKHLAETVDEIKRKVSRA